MAGTTYCTDVLVVGGGPVGLSLGLDLQARKVDFLLLEATDGHISHSRVGAVGPRSMEFMRGCGMADRVRAAGPSADTRSIACRSARCGPARSPRTPRNPNAPGGRALPRRPGAVRRGRGPCPRPLRRARHEHRHRRCRQPRLEGRLDGDGLFGRGFVLLCFRPAPETAVLRRACEARGVPLAVAEIPDGRVARLYGRPFVLMRPDGHVAWRGPGPPPDAGALTDRIRGAWRPNQKSY